MNTWLSSIDSRCSYSVSQVWAFMFVVQVGNWHVNCQHSSFILFTINDVIYNISKDVLLILRFCMEGRYRYLILLKMFSVDKIWGTPEILHRKNIRDVNELSRRVDEDWKWLDCYYRLREPMMESLHRAKTVFTYFVFFWKNDPLR